MLESVGLKPAQRLKDFGVWASGDEEEGEKKSEEGSNVSRERGYDSDNLFNSYYSDERA